MPIPFRHQDSHNHAPKCVTHRLDLGGLAMRSLLALSMVCFSAALLAHEKFSAQGKSSEGFNGDEVKSIAEWLEQALKGESPQKKSQAIYALTEITSESLKEDDQKAIVNAIKRCLKTTKEDNTDRRNLVVAAGRTKSAELIPELAPHLRGQFGVYVIVAFKRIGDPKPCPELLKIAQDAKAPVAVRIAACDALGQLGTDETLKSLEKLHDKEKVAERKSDYATAMEAIKTRLAGKK